MGNDYGFGDDEILDEEALRILRESDAEDETLLEGNGFVDSDLRALLGGADEPSDERLRYLMGAFVERGLAGGLENFYVSDLGEGVARIEYRAGCEDPFVQSAEDVPLRIVANLEKGAVKGVNLNVRMRGRGLGRKVVLACEDFFRKVGVREIDLGELDETGEAVGFWSALGYETSGLKGYKKLD
jgi:GNAT superfamily N-acetyltransferase